METFGAYLAGKGTPPVNDGPGDAVERLLAEIREALTELVDVARTRADTQAAPDILPALSALVEAIGKQRSDPEDVIDALRTLKVEASKVAVHVQPTPVNFDVHPAQVKVHVLEAEKAPAISWEAVDIKYDDKNRLVRFRLVPEVQK